MAERESRKRKFTEEGSQYRQGVAVAAAQSEQRKKSRTIGKEVNTDLSDLFGKMKASDQVPVAAIRDVEMDMAARGRRKTRKASKKKFRKTRKH